MEKKHCTAIVLAGGQGRRMGQHIQKQYLDIKGKPLIYYSLQVFEKSGIIDDVVLVAGKGQIEYVRKEIVERYGFHKVRAIAEGGRERYHSVWEGLKVLKDASSERELSGYVFIHDSARPFVDEAILKRTYEGVIENRACVAGMPSKDTVKIVDAEAFAAETPDRSRVWMIQTPQVFEISLIIEAYSRLMRKEYTTGHVQVTDDAMVVEQEMNLPVKMIEGSYENIKVTTPEDLAVADAFVQRMYGQQKNAQIEIENLRNRY